MTQAALFELWVYLSASPLLWLTATLLVYVVCERIHAASLGRPVTNPVLLSVMLLGGLLVGTGTRYEDYFGGAQFVHFLLGPATIALAIPLYASFDRLTRLWIPLSVGLLSGSAVSVISVLAIACLLGASPEVSASLAPKSVTAPVAMAIAAEIGGLPSLTAVVVVATGILGAAVGPAILDLLRIRDQAVRGFAMGLSAHGIGTARALQDGQEAGGFSGLGMGLNALVTALVLPGACFIVACQ